MHEQKPRMGRIGYLNVLPIYHALETGHVPHGYELVYGPPAALNTMMSRGELAVSSTSCIEYARRPEQYWLLPDLAIGSHGAVMSVLLLSRVPVDALEGKTVLVSAQTHTSAALLRLLLKNARLSVHFVTGNATEQMGGGRPPDAVLAIGDEALRLRNHPAYPYIWDLGAAWLDWTHLPFTFGVWVVSRKAAALGSLAADPAATLHAGRDWGAAHMDEILDIAAANSPLSREELAAYFTGLSYKLGDVELQGLRLFYEYLATAGEIPAAPDLAFWPGG